jgi:uncharacterized protein YegL
LEHADARNSDLTNPRRPWFFLVTDGPPEGGVLK